MCAEFVTTPPLPPSSSPGQADMMDMSPLPRKGPFAAQTKIDSPTPGADDMMLESPVPRSSSLEHSKLITGEYV